VEQEFTQTVNQTFLLGINFP